MPVVLEQMEVVGKYCSNTNLYSGCYLMLELVTCSCLDAGESKFAVSSPILLVFKMIINHPLSSAVHAGVDRKSVV